MLDVNQYWLPDLSTTGSILTFKDKFALQLVRPTCITLHLENDIPIAAICLTDHIRQWACNAGRRYIHRFPIWSIVLDRRRTVYPFTIIKQVSNVIYVYRTRPYTTPLERLVMLDKELPTFVCCDLSVKKFSIQLSRWPEMPYDRSLSNNLLCDTQSDARLKSIYATATDFLLFIVKVQSSYVSSWLLVEDRPDKKPCWCLVIY